MRKQSPLNQYDQSLHEVTETEATGTDSGPLHMHYGFQCNVSMGFMNVQIDSVSSPWEFFLMLICIVQLG